MYEFKDSVFFWFLSFMKHIDLEQILLTGNGCLLKIMPVMVKLYPGGRYSQKNWVGCAVRFPKPLPYLWLKSACDTSYSIYDLTKNSKPYLWPDHYIKILSKYREHNFWRAFVDLMVQKWLLKNIPILIKAKVQKHTPFMTKIAKNQLKSIPYLWPKRLKNHTLWGRTYLYSPYLVKVNQTLKFLHWASVVIGNRPVSALHALLLQYLLTPNNYFRNLFWTNSAGSFSNFPVQSIPHTSLA